MRHKISLSLLLSLILLIAGCNKPEPEPQEEPDTRYKAEHSEQVKKTIRDYLGNGYRGYEYYANPESVAATLFDLNDHKNVDIISAESFKDRFSSGETRSEFFDSFSAGVSAGGTYEGFSGEISSNFTNEVLRNKAHSFATSHVSQKYYRLTVAETAALTEQAKMDLESLEPSALFTKYGTHYLKSIFIGGRVSFSTFIDRTQFKDSTKFQAAVNASYLDVVKGSASAEAKKDSNVQMVTKNRQIDVIGGDPAEANNVENGSGDPASTYNTWSRSVPNFMSIADFADGGMVPIYELIADPERKQTVLSAWEKFMEENTASVLKEPEAPVVKKNSKIKLMYSDGRYISTAPYKATNAYYYPSIADTGIKLILGGTKDPLLNKNNVSIKTSETFKDSITGKWSKRTYLGAFKLKHWLYYWEKDGAKTNWVIEKVIPSADERVHFEDQVYIKNEFFKDGKVYLSPSSDGYLTTIKEPRIWIIKPAK